MLSQVMLLPRIAPWVILADTAILIETNEVRPPLNGDVGQLIDRRHAVPLYTKKLGDPLYPVIMRQPETFEKR